MKIVVLDGYALNPGDLSWEGFKELGEFSYYDRTSKEQVLERIGRAEAVISNKVLITREILEACPQIKYVGVLATGYNIIDIEAAAEKGVVVCNIPAYSTSAVAQMVFAHILNICQSVQSHSESVMRGDWSKSRDFCYWNSPLTELDGKTMGIIGFGRTGQKTAQIAKAFGLNVLVNNGNRPKEVNPELGCYVGFEELLAKSDIISLHCPLFPETEGLINKDSIAQMKEGVILINTSRGGMVIEQDLADALEQGKIRAAGVDVVSSEPIREDNPLLKAKNCFITPHIAWAPLETRARLMDIAVQNLRSFLEGHTINNVAG
ncbi:MAG: D-2-hydroxyacid dehydrogenase [Spirochaetales bacterium]|nr:D-2-hydroxyacid dehydrogenase [Spirochaetales bacterium]